VCGGNTCRSPIAKAIPKQKLKVIGKLGQFGIDSAGH
jgi:protein-tyrosine-phosphatase